MVITHTPFTLFESFETDKRGVIRRRTLRFDFNALADFEQEVGMGFAQLMKSSAIFATARALLWAGLKHEDPTLTIPKVGTLLMQYSRAGGTIEEALQAAFRAAIDQGALGRPETKDGNESAEGNAPEDPAAPAVMAQIPETT